MELTSSNLISIAATVAAIIGSAAVAQFKINSISEQIKTLFKCKADMDHRLDMVESADAVSKHRLDMVTSIINPDELRKANREIATLINEIQHLKSKDKSNG
tara:strand:+ start:208 stop:513 length:306 start_codon:yes stop_codon:yes gene_type:complete